MLIKAANVCRKPDLRALGRASARRPRQEDIPSPRHEPQASWVIKMFSVIFEVHPKKEQFELYLALAKDLKPILQGIDGFVDNERFESARRPGWILSHSTWRDEKSVVRWRTVAKHHETQQRGRDDVFQDYHLRVGEVVSDTAPPDGVPLAEQRLDETEVGAGKFATLTEILPASTRAGSLAPSGLADRLSLDRTHSALIDHDVFSSIYSAGKLALLATWRDRSSAEQFEPQLLTEPDTVRHRVVRIVRDYGMFDRRESPQYYPDIPPGPTTHR
jgi:heme-degrading monooxygenase HmoA